MIIFSLLKRESFHFKGNDEIYLALVNYIKLDSVV